MPPIDNTRVRERYQAALAAQRAQADAARERGRAQQADARNRSDALRESQRRALDAARRQKERARARAPAVVTPASQPRPGAYGRTPQLQLRSAGGVKRR